MILELIQNSVESFAKEKTGYLLLSWEQYFPEKVIYLKRLIDALTGQLPSFEKEEFSFILAQVEDFLNNPKKQADQEKIFFEGILSFLNTIEDTETKANSIGEFFVKLHNVSIIHNPIRINFDPKHISFESYQRIFDSIGNSKLKLKQMACYVKVLQKFPYSLENKKFYDHFLSVTKEMITPKDSSVSELVAVLDINYFPQGTFLDLDSGHNYTDKYLSQSLADLKKESKASVEVQIDHFINQFLIEPVYDDNYVYIVKKIKGGEFGQDNKNKMIGILKKFLDEKIDDPVFYAEVHDTKNIINGFFNGISTPTLKQKQIECAPLLKLLDFLSEFINISKTSTDFPVVQNLIPLIFKRQQKIINEASKEELIDYLFEIKSKSKKIATTSDEYTSNHQRHHHSLSGTVDPFLIQYNSMLMMKISERLCII